MHKNCFEKVCGYLIDVEYSQELCHDGRGEKSRVCVLHGLYRFLTVFFKLGAWRMTRGDPLLRVGLGVSKWCTYSDQIGSFQKYNRNFNDLV